LLRVAKHDDRRSKWAQELQSRAGHNKTLVAMANKTARIAWAMLRSGENYKWPDRPVADRSLIRSYECEVEDLMV
jgi:hypothetical protein